jgi:hypothetical protein
MDIHSFIHSFIKSWYHYRHKITRSRKQRNIAILEIINVIDLEEQQNEPPL